MTSVVDPILALHRKVGLDIAVLLRTIPGGDGGGEDIRYAPEMDALAELRREDTGGSQGVWQTTQKKADWKAVLQQGTTLIGKRSKDLQVAVWVVQALVRLKGIKGLAAGLDMLVRLSREHWSVLWPRPDGDDWEPRMAPFFWLDAQLPAEVLQVEATEPPEGTRIGLSYQEIVKGRKLRQLESNNHRAYEAALADGDRSPDAIDGVVEDTGDLFYIGLATDLAFVRRGLDRLCETLDELAPDAESPSFSGLTTLLRDFEAFVTGVLTMRGLETGEPAGGGGDHTGGGDASDGDDMASDDDAMVDDDDDAATFAALVGDGRRARGAADAGEPGGVFALPPITDRSQAYRLLDHAADWLLAHEPHSPAPYLVKRAVSWEKASLRAVLLELMARGGDSEAILENLGIDQDGRPAGSTGAAGPGGRRAMHTLGDD